MKKVTFEEAAQYLIYNYPATLIFKAHNNKYPENIGFTIEIHSLKELCDEYAKLGDIYYNIDLLTQFKTD